MKFKLIETAALSSVLLTQFSVNDSTSAQSYRQVKASRWSRYDKDAQLAIDAKDWSSAEQKLKLSLEHIDRGSFKQKLPTLFKLASVEFEARNYSECEHWLTILAKSESKLTGRKQKFASPLELLGDVRCRQERYQEAIDCYRRAMDGSNLAFALSSRQKERLQNKLSSGEQKKCCDVSIREYQVEYGVAVQFVDKDEE